MIYFVIVVRVWIVEEGELILQLSTMLWLTSVTTEEHQ